MLGYQQAQALAGAAAGLVEQGSADAAGDVRRRAARPADGGAGAPAGDDEMRGEMFICGVFSLLDRMLGQPFAELFKSVPVPDRVQQALVDGSGPFQPYLHLVRALESGRAQRHPRGRRCRVPGPGRGQRRAAAGAGGGPGARLNIAPQAEVAPWRCRRAPLGLLRLLWGAPYPAWLQDARRPHRRRQPGLRRTSAASAAKRCAAATCLQLHAGRGPGSRARKPRRAGRRRGDGGPQSLGDRRLLDAAGRSAGSRQTLMPLGEHGLTGGGAAGHDRRTRRPGPGRPLARRAGAMVRPQPGRHAGVRRRRADRALQPGLRGAGRARCR